MGRALELESDGEQVDRGDERAEEYWDNLRTHFEQQVNELEPSLKETPWTAEIRFVVRWFYIRFFFCYPEG
jgi:plasmid stabilization system protein ParE